MPVWSSGGVGCTARSRHPHQPLARVPAALFTLPKRAGLLVPIQPSHLLHLCANIDLPRGVARGSTFCELFVEDVEAANQTGGLLRRFLEARGDGDRGCCGGGSLLARCLGGDGDELPAVAVVRGFGGFPFGWYGGHGGVERDFFRRRKAIWITRGGPWKLPHTHVKYRKSLKPVHIPVKDRETGRETKKSLIEYVKETCPDLAGEHAQFVPTPWLFNGHLQTAYASAFNKSQTGSEVMYERKLIDTPDGGQIALDWTPILTQKPFDDTPTLVVLHGLTGGSHESYVRGLLEIVTRSPYNFRAVVVNFRGCAESKLVTPQLYSGAYTDDLRIALRYIRSEIPNAKLMAIGFSLGSNVLVKYLGEEGDRTPFIAGISVGNPFDFLCSSILLDRTWVGKNVYSHSMCNSLKASFARHADMLLSNPELDSTSIAAARTLREFDTAVTRVVFGYDTVNDYYRDASSSRFITRVRVPLLCLNAVDDPIAAGECIPYDECRFNPNVLLATTSQGGHLGWFEGLVDPKRWCIKPLSQFIAAMLESNLESPPVDGATNGATTDSSLKSQLRN
ncbi:Alpha/Beta hydrolase protein [Jimgerdemannia flammicorona]|uniref:Alpha/Beta hydrolase protein n=1 Tax=Jimgerdemannia flammicorona TaxID=994334 RepID=A0A433QSN6_9FUNG|nr:Alpha/Beta hydrolase protein [Jimgerdemannia flammicorona]